MTTRCEQELREQLEQLGSEMEFYCSREAKLVGSSVA
jgi:hypothetical protein